MDGGSTDGSVQILAAAMPPVVWDSSPDHGQSDAINKAFARSTGDIIGWLNSDDAYFSRDVVARAVSIFENHPQVGVVYGHAALVNGDGTLLHVIWTPTFARKLISAYNLICQPTAFIRRSVIGRQGLVDPEFQYMMDYELWLYLAGRTHFRRLDRVLAIDRHHLQRKSYTRLDLSAQDDKVLRQRYRIHMAASNPVLHRSVKVAMRVAGLSKVPEAVRGGDALSLGRSSLGAVALRQVAQFRRWMPAGDDL